MILDEAWESCWRGILASGSGDEAFENLLVRYREPHRAYHTIEHVAECLEVFGRLRSRAVDAPAVGMAIWFHDAVYETRQKDNEERSADLAGEILERAGVSAERIEAVRSLILVTRHNAEPATGDEAILLDCDLAILGAPRERFAEYEEQIRREYAWVPGILFSRERAKILRGFLERPRIYRTEVLFSEREAQARENLTRVLS